MIKQFRGEYQWLSNFAPCKIYLGDFEYPTVENYYQAQKTLDNELKKKFTSMTPMEAKRRGRLVKLEPEWENIKEDIMLDGLREKFWNSKYLPLLQDTGDEEIQEGNYWGDTYWGVCLKTGEGQNRLGKLIMQVREEIREQLEREGPVVEITL